MPLMILLNVIIVIIDFDFDFVEYRLSANKELDRSQDWFQTQ